MEWTILARWLGMFAGLTICGLPLSALVFSRFPDRGAALALPISLSGLALSMYWLGHVALSPVTLAAALGLLVGSAAVAATRTTVPWREGVEAFVVFASAFVAYGLFRSSAPFIRTTGGEQFLHFGLLSAANRASELPLYDVWFAGEHVRYYIGTHVLSATLATLTGTEPRYAYNLAMAGYFGVLVVAAYGVGGALASEADRPRRIGSVLSVFFVAVAGYAVTAARLAYGWVPDSIRDEYAEIVFGAIRHGEFDSVVASQSSVADWFWFYDRYVIDNALTEFPMYSFVKADHHGHTITTGFLVLVAAFAFAYYLTPETEYRRRRGIVFGVLPAMGGLLGVMNAWVLPAAVGMIWLALIFAPAHPSSLGGRTVWLPAGRLAEEGWRFVSATAIAIGVGVVAILWGAPFLLFGTPTNDGIGFFPPRTSAFGLLLQYGPLLVLFGGFLLARWVRVYTGLRTDPGDVLAGVPIPSAFANRPRAVTRATIVGGVLVGIILVAIARLLEFPALVFVFMPLAAAWILARTDDSTGFELVLLVGGLGLVLAMEVVHARVWPPGQPRWNTTLKVSIQAWTLLGLAAAGIVVRWVGDTVGRRLERASVRLSARTVAVVGLCVAVVLVSSPFAYLAFVPELGEAGTLDGLETYERTHSSEMEAIAWLDDRDGSPVLLEAPGRQAYRWQNPASTLTGLPTVVGWEHQKGYRGIEAFERRADDVDDVYVGENRTAHVDRYAVDYVYVGPIERERYGTDLEPFDSPIFEVATETDSVTVYAVDADAISSNRTERYHESTDPERT